MELLPDGGRKAGKAFECAGHPVVLLAQLHANIAFPFLDVIFVTLLCDAECSPIPPQPLKCMSHAADNWDSDYVSSVCGQDLPVNRRAGIEVKAGGGDY